MMDYKRAYQMVLKKVEDLEEENERLREVAAAAFEVMVNGQVAVEFKGEEDKRDRLGVALYHAGYDVVEDPIHPQSE